MWGHIQLSILKTKNGQISKYGLSFTCIDFFITHTALDAVALCV